MQQPLLLDPKTFSPWSNICTVGLQLAASCAHAGCLDWASNLEQLRHLKVQTRLGARGAPPPPRRPPKLVRRLFIWGFICANAAISIAWAHAADEAAAVGVTGIRAVSLRPSHARAPRSLVFMGENFGLSGRSLRQGRWWTLLTSGVSHVAPAHLIVNMCEFYTWASRCFDLGLGPGSVAGLMPGSAVCCNVAGLASDFAWWPTMHMGASGIISGLSESSIALARCGHILCRCVARVIRVIRVEHSLAVVARLVDLETTSQGSLQSSWSP